MAQINVILKWRRPVSENANMMPLPVPRCLRQSPLPSSHHSPLPAQAMLPSWACLGPNFGTKLRMLSPTCIQACPSCAWAQIGASWPEFGTSYASVRPNLRPRKFDPSRLLVGPSRPASLPLCPILWVREVPVAKRLEYLALPQALKGSVVPNRTDILDVMVRTTTIQFVKNFEA